MTSVGRPYAVPPQEHPGRLGEGLFHSNSRTDLTLVNETELDWSELARGDTRFRRKQLGEDLGCSLYELPPGDASWPYHYHTANEEALYVLAGIGTLRSDGERHDLRTGDYAAFPADGSGGHRVVNDGGEPLRYLMVSTIRDPDVTVYPDSGKLGVFVGAPPGGRDERSLDGYYRFDDAVDYWDGE